MRSSISNYNPVVISKLFKKDYGQNVEESMRDLLILYPMDVLLNGIKHLRERVVSGKVPPVSVNVINNNLSIFESVVKKKIKDKKDEIQATEDLYGIPHTQIINNHKI